VKLFPFNILWFPKRVKHSYDCRLYNCELYDCITVDCLTVDLIAGTRPNFVKIAAIITALQTAQARGHSLRFRLIHTGQHYHKNLSDSLFEQLQMPEPDINLGVGSGTHAAQTAAAMVRYEQFLVKNETDLCVVVGDVNSTLACAITAKKQGIPVAHVEAGLRSFDRSMPEEINRIATDSISDYFFTTTHNAGENLKREGISEDRIHFVGNTMIDTLLRYRGQFRQPALWEALGLQEKKYLVLTLHRPDNVDQPQHLKRILTRILSHSNGIPVIFPVHPRTVKVLDLFKLDFANLHLTQSLSYLEFNYLTERAKGVITDSGGITEETTVMGVPCLTLRSHTERPETVTIGTNELVSTNPDAIGSALQNLFSGQWKKGGIPEYWDGKAAERIVAALITLNS